MAGSDETTDPDPVEGRDDVGPPAAQTPGDDDLVASEGVNETGGEDSPGASLGDDEIAEPNEPS